MKSRRIAIRLDEAEWSRIQAMARDQGVRLSEYIRATLLATHETQAGLPSADIGAAVARLETLCLAAAVSAYEAQNIARASLTPEQSAKVKEHRAAQFAAWRSWGVKAAYIGLDMRPKKAKENDHE